MMIVYILGALILIFILSSLIKYLLFKKNFIPVLMFHRVNDYVRDNSNRYTIHKGSIIDIDEMKVSVSAFKTQLDYLKRKNYQVISMDEYSEIKKNKKKGKYVALTFDDGYEDNYHYAYPLLLERNMKATIYLVANFVDGNRPLPIDQTDNFQNNKPLTWDEIREMHRHNISFGSHTLHHHFLMEIDDENELKREIIESKKQIETELKCEVKTFAYPAGLFNEKIIEIVKQYYENAVITAYGRKVPLLNDDPYLIEREAISRSDSLFMFKLKLWGVHRFIRKSICYQALRRIVKWQK